MKKTIALVSFLLLLLFASSLAKYAYFAAAKYGNTPAVAVLGVFFPNDMKAGNPWWVKKGSMFDPRFEAREDDTALAMALLYEPPHWDTAKFLIKRGANPNQLISKAVWQAIQYKMLEHKSDVVDFLLSNGASLDRVDPFYLQLNDNLRLAQVIAKHQGENAGSMQEADLLTRISPSERPGALRDGLMKCTDLPCVEKWIKLGADLNNPTPRVAMRSPLEEALEEENVHWGNPQLPALFIQAGADVNKTNDLGITPIFSAQTAQSVDLLEQAGADLFFLNKTGQNALVYANAEATKALLSKNVRWDQQDHNGAVAVFWAAERPGALDVLLAAGADINAQNNNGDTPLSLAVKNARGKYTISNLLSRGARTDIPDNKGLTPFDALDEKDKKIKVELDAIKQNPYFTRADVQPYEQSLAANNTIRVLLEQGVNK